MMSETNTDEQVLLQNENNDQFKISNKSNKQIKTEKEDESLDINDQNIYMKNNIEAIHDECITKISENYTKLKSILSETVNYKIEASDRVEEKIREKILDFQQKTAIILSDVCECN